MYVNKLYGNKLFFFVVGLAMASMGYSQSKKDPVKTTASSTKKVKKPEGLLTNTLLWEITGKGLKTPSYLFGTMHILCSEDANLSDNLKNIIRDCGQIYFEIDMDNMKELMGAMKYLRMNDGKKLSELLTAEEYEKVKNWFDNNRSMLPFSMMTRFKPFFISSLIGEQMMSCEQKNGMEQLIMKESKQYGKEIKGLETTEYQASIFDSIPYEKQAKDLVAYIDSIDNYKKTMLEMVDVYRKQDLGRMDSLMQKSDPGMMQYMDMLLYNRNRHWATQMPAIMNEMPTLFAVGAGHLPGEEGVINLLSKQGYEVNPVKN